MSENYQVGTKLITEEEILKRAKEIGQQITQDYQGQEVLFIGILKGAVLWLSDVIKNVELDTKIDFMAVSSYGAETKTSGIVRIIKDLDTGIEGKNVIIVEDIIDSGITLNYLKGYLQGRMPKSLKICTLLDKPAGRRTDIKADYTGFEVEDIFIVGYGLDYDQKYRNLPYISYLK
jgi:hypoxanthine phosphoribosyltransferase